MTEVRRLPDALKVRAQHQLDEIAHDDGRRMISFADWDREADALGGGLAARGLRPGDRVLLPISNANAFDMLVAVQGVLRAGGIACPVNPRLMPDEMAFYARLTEPAMTITDIPERMAVAGAGTIFAVDAVPNDPGALPDQSALDPKADAIILQTSGTTGGKLKGVVIAHPDALGDSDGISRQPSKSMAHALPLTGSGGAMAAGLLPIKTGATCYTMRKFDPEGFLRLMVEKKPDTVFLVPAMLRLILDLPNVRDFDLSGTKWLITGSAPLPHDSVMRSIDLWPRIRMRNSYAMSEGGAALTTTTREHLLKPGCVGKMMTRSSCATRRAMSCRKARPARSTAARASRGATGATRARAAPRLSADGPDPATSVMWMPTETSSCAVAPRS
ncbi:MAG: acyl--CoA ligase [Sphingomonadaceae bacterium]|nr:acyl--CoA ligase [Sphingomonadaceae bacterium]